MKIILTIVNKSGIKRVYTAPRDKWRLLYHRIASAVAQKYFLKVIYQNGNSNEGEYTDKREAKKALSAFMEI